MQPGPLLINLVKEIPLIAAKTPFENEKGINPAYSNIENCLPLCPDEKRIWLLRSDLVLAVGIKNAWVQEGNTSLLDKVDESVRHYIDPNDRYGHPSLAKPEGAYDGSVYYAGWLYQHANHLEVFLSSGRYQNIKITPLQKCYIERYLAMRFMAAYGEQDIIFLDWEKDNEMELFLGGKLLQSRQNSRTYSPTNIKNKSLFELAIEHGDHLVAKQLYTSVEKIPSAIDGKTHAIHVFSREGYLDLVKQLVAQDAQLVHTKDLHQQTPLLWAASRGHTDVVNFLMQNGANIHLPTVLPTHHKEYLQENHCSPLDLAIKGGHLSTIAVLENAGAKTNRLRRHDKINNRSLSETIKAGDLERVQLFIKYNKGLLSAIDEEGYTPLHQAAYSGQMEMVQYLISEGAVLDARSPFSIARDASLKYPNKTALDGLIEMQEHDAIAILLFEQGATVAPAIDGTYHMIHVLAKNGLLNHVQQLIEGNAALVQLRDGCDQTALLWAASRGRDDVVELLINHHSDINAVTRSGSTTKDSENNRTVLDWAICGRHMKTIRMLLQAGAKANYIYSRILDLSPREAIEKGDLSEIEMFRKCYSKLPSYRDKEGYTLLHYAAIYGQIEIARYLIEQDADVDMLSSNQKNMTYPNRTALDIALRNDSHVELAILLNDASEKKRPVKHGVYHLIHMFAKNGLIEPIQKLIADNPMLIDLRDHFNQTPLLWAASLGRHEVVAFLIEKGANLHATTQLPERHTKAAEENNRSVLEWAIKGGDTKTIELLNDAIENEKRHQMINHQTASVDDNGAESVGDNEAEHVGGDEIKPEQVTTSQRVFTPSTPSYVTNIAVPILGFVALCAGFTQKNMFFLTIGVSCCVVKLTSSLCLNSLFAGKSNAILEHEVVTDQKSHIQPNK